MKSFLIGITVVVALASARPQSSDLQDSISSVLQTLVEDDTPVYPQYRRYHPQLITKHDFIKTRKEKSSHINIPKEFTISTNLHVSHDKQTNNNNNYRSARSHGLFGSSRRAKQGFSDLASAVRGAPTIEGVRVPDDESDAVVHRGGRFINNMYVPDPEVNSVHSRVPEEVVITAHVGPSQGYTRTGRSYEPQDQSSYVFSPLQHFEEHQRGGAAVFPADNEDFVIEMQTYKQCPECPAFSVPVPVPRVSQVTVERSEEKSLLARLADIFRPVVKRAKEFVSGKSGADAVSSRVDNDGQRMKPGNRMAPIMASLAAVGLGLASYFSPAISGSGRGFEDNTEYILNTIDDELETMSHYTVDDDQTVLENVLCLPRQYCDRFKNQKHLLDQYPNMKTVAAFLTEKYFENIQEDSYTHGQCNIRQCLNELLN